MNPPPNKITAAAVGTAARPEDVRGSTSRFTSFGPAWPNCKL